MVRVRIGGVLKISRFCTHSSFAGCAVAETYLRPPVLFNGNLCSLKRYAAIATFRADILDTAVFAGLAASLYDRDFRLLAVVGGPW